MVTDVARPIAAGLLENKTADARLALFSTFTEGATVIINRMPTPDDRKILSARHREIESVLAAISTKGPDFAEAKRLLAQFFLGYPSLLNADAPGLVTAYVSDLRSLPLYAIKQALDDIKHGRVMVSDNSGGQMPIDKDWPPSSSRVYDIAVKISDPKWREFMKLSSVLGSVQLAQPEMTIAERDRVKIKIRAMAADFAKRFDTGDLQQITSKEEAEQRAAVRAEKDRLEKENEYRALGLEPRYADPEKKVVISLAMMLSLGWGVGRDATGANVLVSAALERV